MDVDQATAGLRAHVRVWRHELRGPGGAGLELPPAYRALLRARRLPIGGVSLVDVGHNLVVAGGLNINRDRVRGVTSVPAISHLAVGLGSTAVASTDIALGAEVFRDVFTQVESAAALLIVRYYLGPNHANGFTLREVGIFNAASGPTLYARRVLASPIVKTIDVAITIDWSLSWIAV